MTRAVTRVRPWRLLLAAALFAVIGLPLQVARAEAPADRTDPCYDVANPIGNGKGLAAHCRRAGSSAGVARADFNHDGYGDLAIGVPEEDQTGGGAEGSGAVVVIYGSAHGLDADGTDKVLAAKYISQGSDGMPGVPEEDDHFGSALAAGDFNGDSYSDLAVGVPDEDIDDADGEDHQDVGAVNVIYGSGHGLDADGSDKVRDAQFWEIRHFFCIASCSSTFDTEYEHFGRSLAWGDFDDDGVGDLAIGVPEKFVYLKGNPGGLAGDDSHATQAGAVAVLYGDDGIGLRQIGFQVWDQQGEHALWQTYSQDIQGTAENGDAFGKTIVGGDFDGNGVSDLAIGVPDEDIDGNGGVGAVHVLFGRAGVGLANTGNQLWTQASLNTSGLTIDDPEIGQHFGDTLAAKNFDGRNGDDLAVASPTKNVQSARDAGTVSVIYSAGSSGLSATGRQILRTGLAARDNDRFGQALAAGDFDGTGKADLAVGIPFGDVTTSRNGSTVTLADAGYVNVFYSAGTTGLTTTSPQLWHQDSCDQFGCVEGTAEAGDRFGDSLSAWNFGVSDGGDLAIGAPFDDVGSVVDAGAVNVLYGQYGAEVLSTVLNAIFTQSSPGVPGGAETGDHFGRAMY